MGVSGCSSGFIELVKLLVNTITEILFPCNISYDCGKGMFIITNYP